MWYGVLTWFVLCKAYFPYKTYDEWTRQTGKKKKKIVDGIKASVFNRDRYIDDGWILPWRNGQSAYE
jgi:hypothetical protein